VKSLIKLKQAVIVEGKYDKIRLSNIVSAPIFTTDGFRLFKNKEKIALLRAVAQKHGLIVLTDSDSAGNFIRSRLKTYIGEEHIINVYLPQIKGKEKRKAEPSAEGYLGVEGIDAGKIRELLSPFDSASGSFCTNRKEITKLDFFEDGLSGGEGSAALRDAPALVCGLPPKMTANALLSALNVLYTFEEYKEILKKVEKS
jgi:ribonuclease M5